MNIETHTKSFNENFTRQNANNALGGTLKGAIDYSDNMTNTDTLAENSNTTSFKAELEQFLKDDNALLPDASVNYNIQDILADMDIAETVNLETLNIEKCDAMFFINVLNQAGVTNYTVSNDGSIIDAMNYKSIEVSRTLSNLLLKAQNTKQAVRLDFDNNVTVILKLTDGKINAHFIPGDKAVEEYLKNNIPYLKQRFDEQNIPYANLSYKQQQHRENKQQNKEKNNE